MQSAEKNTNKIIEFLRDKNDDKKIILKTKRLITGIPGQVDSQLTYINSDSESYQRISDEEINKNISLKL